MKESIPKQRTDVEVILAGAGLEFTPTHLIAQGYRIRLDAIAAYGPERQLKHFRKPVLAFLFALVCVAITFFGFDGIHDSAGQVFAGVALLLAVNGTMWLLMAVRSPAVELILTTGARERLPLASKAMLPAVLAAIDGATGGGGRR